MSIKQYILTTSLRCSLNIEVEGNPLSVTFVEGRLQPYRENGTYTTADVKIQSVLDNHPLCGFVYTLYRERQDEVPPDGVPVELETKVPETETSPAIDIDGVVNVVGINTANKAKIYIHEHFTDIPFAKLNNIEKIMEAAKRCNLAFPDWVH